VVQEREHDAETASVAETPDSSGAPGAACLAM